MKIGRVTVRFSNTPLPKIKKMKKRIYRWNFDVNWSFDHFKD